MGNTILRDPCVRRWLELLSSMTAFWHYSSARLDGVWDVGQEEPREQKLFWR